MSDLEARFHEHSLGQVPPAERRAAVTETLAAQVSCALQILRDARASAALHDANRTPTDAIERGDELADGELPRVLLRLVFLLYAEAHGLVPNALPPRAPSLRGLYTELLDERSRDPDTMHRRFDAWPRILAASRADFLRTHQNALVAEPLHTTVDRANGVTPSIDDGAVLAVLERLLVLDGQRLSYEILEVEQLHAIFDHLMAAVQRGPRSHPIPRTLTAAIVQRTLEPLLAAMGEHPGSAQLLGLEVCDPAMGSGAFLLEACRFLADHLEAAWVREGVADAIVAQAGEELGPHARRLVAQRCLYGVDKNALAVEVARLSMWLVTRARELPLTFVDHALRHGDSLVGLIPEQTGEFSWLSHTGAPGDLVHQALTRAIDESSTLRQRLRELAGARGDAAAREKERLLGDADEAIGRARLIADLVVGAFFARATNAAREKERVRRLALVSAWLAQPDAPPPPEELLELQRELRERVPVFHWMLEFPEVFRVHAPDPLEPDAVSRAATMVAFVGKSPFMRGELVSRTLGSSYRDWLLALHDDARREADLAAHFFRRADALLGAHGVIGLVAPTTIARDETRLAALRWLLERGAVIFDAIEHLPWPGGDAAATVSVVSLAKGSFRSLVAPRLGARPVPVINSRLRPTPERADPTRLAANAGLCSRGTVLGGAGFIVSTDEALALRQSEAGLEHVWPLVGSEAVSSRPTGTTSRWVVDLCRYPTEDAAAVAPELLAIVRECVLSEWDQGRGPRPRRTWWRFWEPRTAFYTRLRTLRQCLVSSHISRHLVFAFQPTDRVFEHTLNVFALERHAHFALLQSRIHAAWARLLGVPITSTDLRYTASRCFATFPFPLAATLEPHGAVDEAGERLHEARTRYLVETRQDLTITCDRLADPDCTHAEIVALRALHEATDQAVLAAYGWDDLEVPPYATPDTPEGRAAHQAFEDEVLDRLLVLNARAAAQEQAWAAAGRCVRCGALRARAEVSFCEACVALAGDGGDEYVEDEEG